jgi:hypothetical protein
MPLAQVQMSELERDVPPSHLRSRERDAPRRDAIRITAYLLSTRAGRLPFPSHPVMATGRSSSERLDRSDCRLIRPQSTRARPRVRARRRGDGRAIHEERRSRVVWTLAPGTSLGDADWWPTPIVGRRVHQLSPKREDTRSCQWSAGSNKDQLVPQRESSRVFREDSRGSQRNAAAARRSGRAVELLLRKDGGNAS